MFVRARLVDGVSTEGLLAAAARGVARNQRGTPIAYVVDAQGKIEVHDLVTDRAIGSNWLVNSGLEAGDKVGGRGPADDTSRHEVTPNEVSAQPASTASAPAAARFSKAGRSSKHG